MRFDPDNEKAPPRGAGVQLTYKALANHEAELQKLLQHQEKKNRPIPVNDVDNFARLFCAEYTRKVQDFKVSTADSSSMLNIVAKASCFPSDVRKLASKIREKVRSTKIPVLGRNPHSTYHHLQRKGLYKALSSGFCACSRVSRLLSIMHRN